MTTETDVDVSIRPNKWIKRGPQPESPPPPKSPTQSIRELIQRINSETDPKEKARLEAKFHAECAAYDQLNPDSMPMDISAVYADIVHCIAPIAVEAGVIIAPDIHFPSEITRERWSDIHRQIIACRKSASHWLSKSRKFATDRWGEEFVTRSEEQMELALGIEHKEAKPDINIDAMTMNVCRSVTKWCKVAMEWDGWDKDKAKHVLESLQPAEAMIVRLRKIAGGES